MPQAREGENEVPPRGSLSTEKLFGVEGKVALVTGGGSGIGAMIACTLVQNGCDVFICSRKDTSKFADELTAMGPARCRSLFNFDLAKKGDIERLKDTLDPMLPSGLHILVNNSGTNFNAPLGKYPMEMFSKVYALNVAAVFHLTQVLKDTLEKASRPGDPARVVNISSINGIQAPIFLDSFGYSSSKAAVIHLTKHLSVKMGPQVLVNDIAPGAFPSRMMRGTLEHVEEQIKESTVVGRIGTMADIGGAILFLCGRAGAYVSGATIVLDGGSTVKSKM